jgi:hypothetical protein
MSLHPEGLSKKVTFGLSESSAPEVGEEIEAPEVSSKGINEILDQVAENQRYIKRIQEGPNPHSPENVSAVLRLKAVNEGLKSALSRVLPRGNWEENIQDRVDSTT